MKIKKLLVLSALAFMGLSANAANLVERTEPLEPDFGPGGLTIDNFAATAADFQIGDCYVLYNVGSQAYFGEGNAWGTQVSITTETPLLARFTVPAGMTLEDNALLFNDYANSKTAWKLVFFDSPTSMFVDLGSQANYYWQVVAAGDKTYRLQASPKNPNYTPENNPGFVGLDVTTDPGNTACSPFLDEADGHYIDWQFFAVPEWTSYYKQKDAYDAAMKLKAQIEVCEAAGIDVSAAVAVYNNLDATAEQLNAAIEALKEALASTISGGTAENPADATKLITNPNFDNASSEGWLGTAPNMVGSGSHGPADVAEVYNNTFDTYQDLTGLPDGVYALRAKTAFRGSWGDLMAGTDAAAKLYAKVGDEETLAPFNNIWSCLNTEPMAGETYFGTTAAENASGIYYSPNDPSAFRLYEENGFYDTTLFFEMSGGKVRIGVKNPSKCTDGCDNWSIFDTFTLMYYGSDPAAYQKWVELSVPTVAIPEDALYTQSYYDAYQEALAAGKATNKAEAVAAIAAVKTVAAELQKNINLWQQLQKKADEAMVMISSSDYDGQLTTDDLADWLYEDYEEGILEEVALTNDEIEATIQLIQEMMDAVKAEYSTKIEKGTDLTHWLNNPDFEFGLSSGAAEGWTVTRISGGNVTPGPLGSADDDKMIAAIGKTNHCFESWHCHDWDVWQEIKSAPAGVYQISVQGYVRCEAAGYTQGDEVDPATIPIKLYMNNATSVFPSVYSEEIAPEHFLDDGTLPVIEDHSWTGAISTAPNSMGAASLCFAWGMYQVNTFGLVKEGESMRIGVKGKMDTDWWCIWDNFHIIYQGFDPEYVQPALEAALANIDLSKPMAKSLFEKASELEAAAKTAIEGKDGVKMFKVLSDVSDLVAEIDASVAIFAKLQTAVDNLMAEANESSSPFKKDALALVEEIQSAIDGYQLENEDVDTYMEKIAEMRTKLFLPAYDPDTVSDENPVDFTAVLQTPSFEKDGTNSIDGWVATGHKFGNDDQLFALALESWESVFHIYQDVAGLPDGTYTLKVNGWQRTASPTYLYAESGGVKFSKELIKQAEGLPGGMEAPSSLSGAVEQFSEDVFMNTLVVKVVDGKLRIGVQKEQTSGSDWIVLDNFQLWYHGTNSSLNPDTPESVESLIASEPVKVEYYTLDGRRAAIMQKGILIQRTTYADGKVVVKKIRN